MSITESYAFRTRGRPREFDEEAALDALTGLFWQKGYEATSVGDIVEASGVNKSSLYNAYGSKRDLFRLILGRYVDKRMDALAELAEFGRGRGIDSLHSFLDAIRDFGRVGCLAVNTSTELGTADPTVTKLAEEYRDRTRLVVHSVISAATKTGGLSAELVEARTDMLLSFLLGFSVAVRGGAGDAEVDRLINAARTTVDSW